jgi:cardiolipin synthase
MFLRLTPAYWLTLHGLVTLLAVAVYVVAAHVLQQRRHPTAAIAWMLFIVLAPYLALPMFLTFGSRKLARPRAQSLLPAPAQPVHASWAVRTALALGQPPPAAYQALQIHADGRDALAALWRVLDGATESIDLCTFILGPDALGREVVARLSAKARAGVKVRFMLDGLGSLMSGRPDLKPLTAAGVEMRLFVPPLHSPLKGRTNLRDHRKLLIADAESATPRLWCGGRNLATEYFEGDAKKRAWHDLSFDLAGPLVQQAVNLFEHDWLFAAGDRTEIAMTPHAPSAPHTGAAIGAQLIASGPDQVDDTVYSLLVTAAYRARRRIAIITPYFVPDAALLTALCLAARRGVSVDLLLPAKSNHRLSDLARTRALRALDAAGGHIRLAPQMLHAKLIVIDDELALAGSANLDSRSLFLNYELMIAFHDAEAIGGFAAWFEHEWQPARPHQPKPAGLIRDVAEGLVLWLGFQL